MIIFVDKCGQTESFSVLCTVSTEIDFFVAFMYKNAVYSVIKHSVMSCCVYVMCSFLRLYM